MKWEGSLHCLGHNGDLTIELEQPFGRISADHIADDVRRATGWIELMQQGRMGWGCSPQHRCDGYERWRQANDKAIADWKASNAAWKPYDERGKEDDQTSQAG